MRRRQVFQAGATAGAPGAPTPVAAAQHPPAAAATKPYAGKPCPKCGKLIGQGIYLHVKYCKGLGADV